MWAFTAAGGGVAEVESAPAHVTERVSLPLPEAPSVLSGRLGQRVKGGGDRVEGRRVELSLDPASATGRVPGQVQLVDLRRLALVRHSAVLIQRVDQVASEVGELTRTVQRSLLGQLFLSAGPRRRGQSASGLAGERIGDHFQVPQADLPGGESGGGRRQPGRQHLAVDREAFGHLLGDPHPPHRLSGVAAEQVGDRMCRTGITALGEHPVPVEFGDQLDGQLFQLPGYRLAGDECRHSLVVPSPAGSPPQRRDFLRQQPVCDGDRAFVHGTIIVTVHRQF
jgi:hypothetical protein